MFSYKANVTPVSSMAPARPASAPLTTNARVVVRGTSIIPALRDASGFAPTARKRKPAAVYFKIHHAAAAAARAMSNPA